MKLENQVCTLSQAERLKQLGIDQNSLHYWDPTDGELYRSVDRTAKDIGCVSAFNTAELGAMLPSDYLTLSDNDPDGNRCYTCWKFNEETAPPLEPTTDKWFDTEAQARAWLLIHLLENRNASANAVNESLTAVA